VHLTRRPKYILLLPTTLNRHKTLSSSGLVEAVNIAAAVQTLRERASVTLYLDFLSRSVYDYSSCGYRDRLYGL
jgi:hypothetical protein